MGFHGDAVTTDQRHVAVQHIVIAVHESHEVGLEGRGWDGRLIFFIIIAFIIGIFAIGAHKF